MGLKAYWLGGGILSLKLKNKTILGFLVLSLGLDFWEGFRNCIGDHFFWAFGLVGEMGSNGQLARRVVETDMPIMVQVFRPKPQLGLSLTH